MAVRAEGHRASLYQARKDRQSVAAVRRRRKAKAGHSQVRRDWHALSGAEAGHWRSDAVSQRYRRQAQGSAAALSLALLDGQTQRHSQSSLQHFIRSEPNVRHRQRANRRFGSGKNRQLSFSKHHIFTTPIVHEEFQGLRITPNLYTTLTELDRFCEVMARIARKGLPA